MSTMKAKIVRKNIGGSKSGDAWVNLIRAGRTTVGSVFEPNRFQDKFSIEVRIANGYFLKSEAPCMEAALEEFVRLTDGKYELE